MTTLISVSKADRETGELCAALINPRYITSVVFVPSNDLTAVNFYNSPTLWVSDLPEEIMQYINSIGM